MDIIKLLIIFTGIIIVIRFNTLDVALLVGIASTIILYGISPLESLRLISIGAFSKDTCTFSSYASCYSINYIGQV